MNCLDFRRLIGADPSTADSAAVDHARACAACADFAERTRALDRRILQALQIHVPAEPETQKFLAESREVAANQRWRPERSGGRRWMAVAASLLIGIGVAVAMWVLFPRTALAADLVEHMAHEPQAWTVAHGGVTAAQLQSVLRRSDLRTNIDSEKISYAQSCWFRGRFVPHLVVQDEMGPVTVMLLPDETVAREQWFADGGYSGLILPSSQGSIAVLTRDSDSERARSAAARVLRLLQ